MTKKETGLLQQLFDMIEGNQKKGLELVENMKQMDLEYEVESQKLDSILTELRGAKKEIMILGGQLASLRGQFSELKIQSGIIDNPANSDPLIADFMKHHGLTQTGTGI